MNSILSLVEIKAFTLDSKSCKGFVLKNKFSTNKSTWIYNRSHGLLPGIYLNLTDDNHQYETIYNGVPLFIHNELFSAEW